MKLKLETKTEKQNLTGLLMAGNFIGSSICFLLLMIQFFYFPKYFGATWAFVLVIVMTLAWFNLKFFRSYFKWSTLWPWLKNHN